MPKRILVITHDAYRTGAPILLLNLVGVLKGDKDFSLSFYIKNPIGELVDSFKSLPFSYLPNIGTSIISRIQRKYFTRKTPLEVAIDNCDIILSNTITNGELYPILNKSRKPIITYVHELEIASATYTSEENIEKVKAFTNIFAVPSLAVKKFLTENLAIPEEKIFRLDYYIPEVVNLNSDNKRVNHSFTIGASGTTDWRKGVDVFIIIANEFFKKHPDSEVKFIWKGAQLYSLEFKRLMYEIRKANLENKVFIEAAGSNMDEFYERLNLFLLSSREDPYPLVVLEAARYSIPTICFESSGGITEFVQHSKGGRIAKFLSVIDMVDLIYMYYDQPNTLKQEGKNAFDSVTQLHNNKERILMQFNAMISNVSSIM